MSQECSSHSVESSSPPAAARTYYDSALHMMELQGGSFVRALVACYYVADEPNKRMLRAAFATYFDNYEGRFEQYRAALAGSAA